MRKDDGDIHSLAQIIQITKRVTPIMVRKIKNKYYKGQDGKRRWLAVGILGWKEIPADVEGE